ncbi:MAG: protein TonB [Moritella dasanensis]|jgi:protein TonB
MNLKRYVVFTSLSLLIHGVAFSFMQNEEKMVTISLDDKSQQTNNSVQFIAVSKPKVAEKAKPKKKPEIKAKTEVESEKLVKVKPKPKPKPKAKSKVNKLVAVKVKPKQVPETKPVIQDKQSAVVEKEAKVVPELTAEITPTVSNRSEIISSQSSKAMPKLIAKPKFKVKPTAIKYPRLAKRKNLEGEALIEVWLDKNGKQIKQRLLDSTGYSLLDDAALKTIAAWQFAEQKTAGQAYAYRLQIPIRFKLD